MFFIASYLTGKIGVFMMTTICVAKKPEQIFVEKRDAGFCWYSSSSYEMTHAIHLVVILERNAMNNSKSASIIPNPTESQSNLFENSLNPVDLR